MAEVSYKTCDRCGEKINRHSGKLAIVKSRKHYVIMWIIGGAINERSYDLCDVCTKKLDEFMYGKKD